MKLICDNCLIEYESCPTCEASKYYAYRNHFCSAKCFKESLMNGGKAMRIQYNQKTYTVISFDLDEGKFVTSNGLELKEDEIQAFILPLDKFKELKNHKKKVRKKLEKEKESE